MAEILVDLIDCIVQQVGAANDQETLRNCNLTSKFFRAAAQKQIFFSVRILANPGTTGIRRLQSFREIVSASPNIGSYVKDLTLGLVTGQLGGTPTSLLVLDMLRCVEHITIENSGVWRFSSLTVSSYWSSLHQRMQDAILDMFTRPTLKSVNLRNISGFPLSMLSRLRHLHELELELGDFPEVNHQPPAGPGVSQKPSLRILRLRADSPAIMDRTLSFLFFDLHRPFTFEDLDEVHIHCRMGTFEASHNVREIQRVLNALLPCCLRNFSLKIKTSEPLDFSSATRLQTLLLDARWSASSAVPWLVNSLSSLPPTNTLRTLSITLGGITLGHGIMVQLDEELASTEKYKDCAVEIDFKMSAIPENMTEILIRLFRRCVVRDNFTLRNSGDVVNLSEPECNSAFAHREVISIYDFWLVPQAPGFVVDVDSMMVGIPTEIVHKIVEHVNASGDTSALLACNATSRVYHEAARRNIFAEIHLFVNPTPRTQKQISSVHRMRLLQDLLSGPASSAVASFVRRVVLALQGRKDGDRTPAPMNSEADYILRQLVSSGAPIQEFKLQDAIGWGGIFYPEWSELEFRIKASILRLLSVPTLHDVDISGVLSFPVDLVPRLCQALRTIRVNLHHSGMADNVESSRILDAAGMAEGGERPRSAITSCSVVASAGVTWNKTCQILLINEATAFPLHNLQVFTVSCQRGSRKLDLRLIQKVLDNTLPSNLTSFAFAAELLVPVVCFDFSTSKKLKSLQLGAATLASATVPWIIRCLQTLPPVNTLKDLFLDVGGITPQDDCLADLDTELSRPGFGKTTVIINFLNSIDSFFPSQMVDRFFKHASTRGHFEGEHWFYIVPAMYNEHQSP